MSHKKFHVANFGCRAAQSEGAAVHEQLRARGLSPSKTPFGADVLIVNSCTVTEEADREVRRLIRRVARRSSETRIVVTGCYAQRSPEALATMPNVSCVVGNSHKSMVGELAIDVAEDPSGGGRSEVFCSDIFQEKELTRTPHQGSRGRTRATVKVQDGCDANCSFCIIPSVRGRGRSLGPAELISQVRELVDRGYREVVLSGIHLGSYGRDLSGAPCFEELVRMVLDEVPGLERLRLSSIEPLEVTPGLIDLVAAHSRMARHLHVPLQSGSARVLRAMRRPYSPEYYSDLVRRIREHAPDAAIGADVMVGFPGESDDEFMETYRLIEASPLTYLHVFPFSSRPGTVAAEMPNPVPDHVSRYRGRLLRNLIARKNECFREEFIGRDLAVLILDEEAADGWRAGITDNFIKIRVPEELPPNRWHYLPVAALEGAGLAAADPLSKMTIAAETV